MQQMPTVPAVTPDEADDLIREGAALIDVREQEEWESERIPGAEFKPMSTIDAWYEDLPKDVTLIVHCHTGQRSARVVDALVKRAGMDNVLNLTGGIEGWKFSQLPIER
jgi:rhodanese-related sulfurtransferase